MVMIMNIKKFNILLVITILLVLIIPSSYAVYTTHNNRLYEVLDKKIIEQAIICYNKKECLTKIITLQELYDKGYLQEQIDPLSKEILNPSTTIDIEKEVVNH